MGRGPYVVPVQGHGLFICATEILQTAGRVAVRTEWNDCSVLEFFLVILGFPTLSSVLTVYWEKLRCPGGAPCGLALWSGEWSSWESRNVAFLGSFVSYLYHLPLGGHTGAEAALLIRVGLFRGLRGCGVVSSGRLDPPEACSSSQVSALHCDFCVDADYHRESCVCRLLRGAKTQVKAT